MKIERAVKIVEKLVSNGIDARLYKGYSGRCMFGAETDGVVVDSAYNMSEAKRVARGLATARTDSLGRGVIFY